MMKHYTIYTAKSGDRYIQTKSKYLAHALAYLGFRFMMFNTSFSFKYSEELEELAKQLVTMRKERTTMYQNLSENE